MSIKLTAASVAALLMAAPALAADMNGIGGNCCADLEERVAELEATAARKGNRKVSVTVYGQVNWALMHYDADGRYDSDDFEDTVIRNNTNDTTKFGFRGDAQIRPGVSAGYLLEIGVGTSDEDEFNAGLSIRHSALYLQHEQFGAFWLGHTSTATDGIVEISIPNVYNASRLLSLEPFTGGHFEGATFGLDGGRTQVAKWVSPTIGGFTASASWMANDDDAWDAALRYAGEGGGFQFAAGIGYQSTSDGDRNVISGSASVLHTASGLFVNGAIGRLDADGNDDPDLTAYHLQGGIEQKFFSPGKTTLYGEWGRVDADGAEADFWGMGAVQNIEAAAMDLYVGYRNYDDISLHDPDCPPDFIDIGGQTLVAGAIIRF